MTTCHDILTCHDMFSLTCLSCEKGVWPLFFIFKLDFDHWMMTCRVMFDMFSLTCLSCDLGAWHIFRRLLCSQARFGPWNDDTH